MAVQVARATKNMCYFSELAIEGKSKRALDYLQNEPVSLFLI